VGRPERGDPRPVADYVLSPFSPEDDVERVVSSAADSGMINRRIQSSPRLRLTARSLLPCAKEVKRERFNGQTIDFLAPTTEGWSSSAPSERTCVYVSAMIERSAGRRKPVISAHVRLAGGGSSLPVWRRIQTTPGPHECGI